MRKVAFLLMFVLLLAACQAEETVQEGSQAAAEEQTVENEPIKITNGEEEIIIEESPQRAITMNQHVTEVMLALGLQDQMVGTAYLDDSIHPDYKEAYESVPVLADAYPSKETVLEANPDFIYAGWPSAFQNEAAGSREELKEFGITTYLHESSNMVHPELDNVFQDIRNIGTIFKEEEAAESLITDMSERIEAAKRKVPEQEEPKKVFVYDSGEDAPTTATQNFLNTLIEEAGADNIFGDIEKGWASVNWEDTAKANPDEIIIIDYGDTSVEDKIAFLEEHPVMQKVKAVKEAEYTVIPLSEAAEGIRAPEAFEKIVNGIYGDK
ncbi:ABC transporter substrate-binding protein [Bacillus piscicola]|uniref:ABC transporter substrate-binding protein n=1 Tax=Bacillus piscicola TaxID=1632684 RepID=UPI001F08DFAE|nr:ABC transporter substrate-binding protein [Bacillus piscicola]